MPDKSPWISILVADDSDDDCRLLRRAFQDAKILNRLDFVPDGQAALDFLRSEPGNPAAPSPGLLLLDLKMPKLDGRQTLEAVRKDPRLTELPVVILTTSSVKEDVMSCYRAGANAVMVKPFAYDEFLDLVTVLKHFWLDHVILPVQFTGTRPGPPRP